MHSHLNLILLASWHNSIQEIFIILTKLVCIYIFILIEQIHNLIPTVWLPARHYETATGFLNAVKHFTGVNSVNDRGIIGKCRGAILQRHGKISSGPVKHRHKVVANQMNVCFSNCLQGLAIIFNQFVPCRKTNFDILMHVDTLNAH